MAEEGFKRKLAAILSADVEGYSRLMGDDEEATVRTLTSYREVLTTLIQQHNGRVLDSKGDNLLAEFVSVVDAVQCAVAVQKEIGSRNAELPENRKMKFRIGINLGDVIQEEDLIYGDGVNIAARLEGLAEPGGICISKTTFDQIESKLPYGYEFLGDQSVKNIAKPVSAYRVLMEPRVTAAGEPEKEKRSPTRRMLIILGAAAVVLLVIAVGVWKFYLGRPTVEPASVDKMAYPLPEKPSIAVLPFDNLSKDPDQEYIADAFSENIITALSSNPYLFVISRSSSYFYKNKTVKIKEVSEELGVNYVLEGSVLKTENKLRVTAQLINALTGYHVWTKKYDLEMEEIFNIIDEISLHIANELLVKMVKGDEYGLTFSRLPKNLEVWSLVLAAEKKLAMWTKGDVAKSKQLILKAMELDPDFAGCWSVLGWIHFVEARFGWSESRSESIKQGIQAANKTIELDDKNGIGYILMANYSLMNGQFDKALAECEKAVQIEPNSAMAHVHLGRVLRFVGRPEEAITIHKKAMRLNPHYNSDTLFQLAHDYYNAKRYAEAEVAFKDTLEHIRIKKDLTPKWTYLLLSAIYAETNREEEAHAYMQKVLEIDPKFSLEDRRKQLQDQYKDTAMIERLIAAHRKAGAPEKRPSK